MKAHCEVRSTASVDATLCEDMWQLFNRHYRGISKEVFESDLRKKKQALLLWRDDQLVGFTSQLFGKVDGHRVVYSGDVIIATEARDIGTANFFHAWAKEVWERCDWWCALSSGPRTFRIPHTFYRRVTQQGDQDETESERSLRHRFAEHTYGARYDSEQGIVRLSHPYIQRNSDQEIRKSYPMDACFRAANPGWDQGDELVSIVNLHRDNWKPIALKILNWKSGGG